MLVADILRRKGPAVVTADGSRSLLQAAQLMCEHAVGCVVVTDAGGGQVTGLLSERDVVRAVAIEGPSAVSLAIHEVARTDVTTTTTRVDVDEVMAVMTQHRQRHVPVLDVRGELCGLVSIGDVVSMRLSELELERSALTDYITRTR